MSETVTNHNGAIMPQSEQIPARQKENQPNNKVISEAHKIIHDKIAQDKIIQPEVDRLMFALTDTYKIDFSQPDQQEVLRDTVRNNWDDIKNNQITDADIAKQYTKNLLTYSSKLRKKI